MAAPSPSLPKDDIFFSYDTTSPNFSYQGIHAPNSSSFLRLTQTDPSGKPIPKSFGRVLYSPAIKFWESSDAIKSFETTIKFKVTPFNDGAADGLTFFIAPFGSTGNTHNLFEVKFDNFATRHIEIDIDSMSQGSRIFDSGTGEYVTAQINYNSKTTTITVDATSGQRTAKLPHDYDLSTILPQQVQVGISSAAGETGNGVYDVISWSFRSYIDE